MAENTTNNTGSEIHESWQFDPDNYGVNSLPGIGLLDDAGRSVGITIHAAQPYGSTSVAIDQAEVTRRGKLAAAAPELLLALQSQELASTLQKTIGIPKADDPRYTPFVGEWNGYHAPEQRYEEFQAMRQQLRRAALAKAQG